MSDYIAAPRGSQTGFEAIVGKVFSLTLI